MRHRHGASAGSAAHPPCEGARRDAPSLRRRHVGVGFPGFISKLWLDRDERDRYRGLYEWNDATGAEFYARSLWRVLELVCTSGSICYKAVPGFRRDAVLSDPQLLALVAPDDGAAWWRVVESA